MFGKLKEKLKLWTKKLAGTEEEVPEEVKEESKEEVKKPIKKEIEKKEKEIKVLEKEIKGKKEELEKRKEIVKEEVKTEKLEEKKHEKVKEEIIEKPEKIVVKIPEEEETKSFFQKVKEKVTFAKVKISEDEFKVYGEELEELLLENNVAYEVAEKIIKKLHERVVGKELLRKEVEFEIDDAFKEIIRDILIEPFNIEDKILSKKKTSPLEPYIILFCGINGTGKTTSIAKITEYLKKQGFSCVLAAADTFRAASIEQLNHHGEKLGVHVVAHEYGHDPAAVAYDAVAYAKKHAIEAVLIDTAGRMHSNKNLMNEIEKVSRVVKPDLKIFVGESITGNDVIEQAKSFDWHVGIDGIILSKSDIDEKGGTALSVGFITKKPILFLGIGQNYGDVEKFDKEKFIKRLGLDN